MAVLQLFIKLECSGAKLFSLAPVLLLYVQKRNKIKNFEFWKKDLWKDWWWTHEKNLNSTLLVMKKLKLHPWKDISSTLTRKLNRVIKVNIAPPPLLDFYSFFISRILGLGCSPVPSFQSNLVWIRKFLLEKLITFP